MDIQRIDSSLIKVLATTDPAAAPLRLALGERVMAQVTGHLADGRLLLDLKGQTIEARSALPLSAGQSIQLEVAGMGQEIALRVLGERAVVSEQRLALGTLAVAHASTPPSPPPDAGALLKALDVEVTSLTSTERGELGRLLGPLRVDSGPSALAVDLQHALQNGGLLFESRVREWLERSQSASPRALPAELGSDLKVLLGLLGRALQSASAGQPGGAGGALPAINDAFAALFGRALAAADQGQSGPVAPGQAATGGAALAAVPQPPQAPATPQAVTAGAPHAAPNAPNAQPAVRQDGNHAPAALPPPATLQEALEAEIARLPVAQRADLVTTLGVSTDPRSPAALAVAIDSFVRKSPGDVKPQLQPWLGALHLIPSAPAAAQALAAAARAPDVPPELQTLFSLLGRAFNVAAQATPPSTAAAPQQAAAQATHEAKAGASPGNVDRQTAPVRADRPQADALQRRALDLVTRELDAAQHNDRPTLETLRAEHAHVRDALLSRQIETAYYWVRDGTLSQQLPLMFGDQVAQAWLRFQRGDPETEREADGRATPGVYSFDLALDPPGLGPLRAHVAWSGRHLRVQFFVAAQPSASVISPALPQLSAALARTGFTKVEAEVMVDASRTRLDPLAPMTPPEGGTILNLRA